MSRPFSELLAESHSAIESALARARNPLVAYSGGKDGLVVAHLMAEHGVTKGVCELSFYYQRQVDDVVDTARRHGFDVSWERRRDDEWLRRHPEFIFADDVAIRSRSFALRHQGTVKHYGKRHGHDLLIFGRRSDHNTVPAMLYPAGGFSSFHPIKDWRTEHVWEYLEMVGIARPWIYSTRHGDLMGNSPFYSIMARDVGGVANAWRIVTSLDASITPARYGVTATD